MSSANVMTKVLQLRISHLLAPYYKVHEVWVRSVRRCAVAVTEKMRGRFGSLAVVGVDSSRMAALGWKADIQPGRMSAFTYTGRSVLPKIADLNGC
jgi:hypothetical protein